MLVKQIFSVVSTSLDYYFVFTSKEALSEAQIKETEQFIEALLDDDSEPFFDVTTIDSFVEKLNELSTIQFEQILNISYISND